VVKKGKRKKEKGKRKTEDRSRKTEEVKKAKDLQNLPGTQDPEPYASEFLAF
jgi:hypothetical protein